jgi:transmembrane sensor
VLITTAGDPQARPFLVDTAQGRLRALGTRFAVRQRDGASHVAVYEGAVEVRPADAPQAVRILAAGEQAGFGRLAVDAPQPADELATAWSAGLLAARDMPLTDFIAELARHRRGRLACDPALASLRVSGMYPLDDIDRVLDMLMRTQPVELAGFGRYWMTVRPRQDRQ